MGAKGVGKSTLLKRLFKKKHREKTGPGPIRHKRASFEDKESDAAK